ncbi:MAG: hypothetical protein LC104_01330 [Bacteroidales bacterium]|nr:hypothetical protein [Bacteroidales bacterium]
MATALHDCASAAVLGASFPPAVLSGSANGAGVDLSAGDGNAFALVALGEISDGATVDVTVQESSDGSSWTAVAGVAFTPMTVGNTVQIRTFVRTKPVVRIVLTVTGTTPEIPVAALIGQQQKSV